MSKEYIFIKNLFLATFSNLYFKYGSNFFPLKSCNFGAYFFHKNDLYELRWILFGHQVANAIKKRTLLTYLLAL
jgi:hypothetical protein